MSWSIYFNDHIYYHIIHIWTSQKGLRVAIYIHHVDCQSQSIWLSISDDLILDLSQFNCQSQSILLSIMDVWTYVHMDRQHQLISVNLIVDISRFDCWSQSIRLLISINLIIYLNRFNYWSLSIQLFKH